jgi:ABC-type sugar transport system ATPase subunit
MSNNSKHELVMEAKDISKFYPGTVALNRVSMHVYKGCVNALVGENGAGKSTLMKIIAGIEKPDKGELILYNNGEAEQVFFHSSRDSEKRGIGIIHQELNLFGEMNVAENIFINQEIIDNAGIRKINHKSQEAEAKKVLKKLGQNIDPKTLVKNLRLGQQQIVEIAKAVIRNPHILIMDEPSSALSGEEVKVLFRVVEELQSRDVAIIYISHRLEEVKKLSKYITILRDANFIDAGEAENFTMNEVVQKMVGKDPSQFFSHTESYSTNDDFLKVSNVTLRKIGGGFLLDDVSFSLKRGEILGIYGLMGSGRTELMETIMGLHPEAASTIFHNGRQIDKLDIRDRIKDGIALIPEDRQRDGLFLNLSVKKNMTISSLAEFKNFIHILKAAETKEVNKKITELRVKVNNADIPISALSGGNQQKVIVGKWLLTMPDLLLMDDPTRGIDIGAKSDIFTIMKDLAKQGVGILFISSEINELFTVSDRILVLAKGAVSGIFDISEATEERLRKASELGIV